MLFVVYGVDKNKGYSMSASLYPAYQNCSRSFKGRSDDRTTAYSSLYWRTTTKKEQGHLCRTAVTGKRFAARPNPAMSRPSTEGPRPWEKHHLCRRRLKGSTKMNSRLGVTEKGELGILLKSILKQSARTSCRKQVYGPPPTISFWLHWDLLFTAHLW